MGRLKPYIITLAVLILGGTVAGKAQSLALKTNMLYDLVVTPSVGVEVGVTDRWSVAFNGTYGWLEGSPWYDNVRVVTGDAELRYWFSHADSPLRGLHAGVYGAVYRYDFLFGSKGQEAKANWGGGVSCGYAVHVSSHFSVDFSLSVGYVGGNYQEYEVSNDDYRHNVWTADKKRHYWGPTKAEVSFVWHIFGSSAKVRKGGER